MEMKKRQSATGMCMDSGSTRVRTSKNTNLQCYTQKCNQGLLSEIPFSKSCHGTGACLPWIHVMGIQ